MKKTRQLLWLLPALLLALALFVQVGIGAFCAQAAVTEPAADEEITYESASSGENFTTAGTATVTESGFYTEGYQDAATLDGAANSAIDAVSNGDNGLCPVLGGQRKYTDSIFRATITPELVSSGWGYIRLWFRVWDNISWQGVCLEFSISKTNMKDQTVAFRSLNRTTEDQSVEPTTLAETNYNFLSVSSDWKFQPEAFELTLAIKGAQGAVYINGNRILTCDSLPVWTGRYQFQMYKSALKADFPIYIATEAEEADLNTCPKVITYDTNGGSSVGFYMGGTVSEAPVSEKENYTLEGWYFDEALTEKVTFPYTVTADAALYAKWNHESYTATFVADGETVDTVEYTVEDSSITEPSVPDKTGYNGTWESYTLSVGGITVNAEYIPIEYTIAYEDVGDSQNENPTSYTVESETIVLKAVAKEGYIFDGWYNGNDRITEIARGSIGDITLSARWTKEEQNGGNQNGDDHQGDENQNGDDHQGDENLGEKPDGENKGGGLSGGAIAGIAVGSCAILAAIIIVVVILRKKKK